MKWLVVTVLCLVAGAAQGQIVRTGVCPVQTVPSINFAELVGTWHDIYRLAEETPTTHDCSEIVVSGTPVAGGAIVPASVLPFSDNRIMLHNRSVQNVTGTIQVDVVAGAGNQVAAIRVIVNTVPRVYRILNPNIGTFLVAHSCEQTTPTTITERALILVRGARALTEAQYTELKVFLSTTTLEVPRLRPTEQDSYICETENVCSRIQAPLISNFNVTGFHGTWYELSRLENDLQRNEDCVTNNYAPVTGQATQTNFTKSMINLNGRQATVFNGYGHMRQANSNPQLGVMTVNFTQGDTARSFEYRILNTDYSTYAVVYSCVNNAGEVSFPNLWVLARDRVVENQTEINRIIANSTVHSLQLRITEQDEGICSSSTTLSASILTVLLTAILVQFKA